MSYKIENMSDLEKYSTEEKIFKPSCDGQKIKYFYLPFGKTAVTLILRKMRASFCFII